VSGLSALDVLSGLDAARGDASLHASPSIVSSFCAEVRDVVLLSSSSRGGSSMFAELLRGCPGTLHFRGEINAFLHQAGLAWPRNGASSDSLDASHAAGASALLDLPLALDVGAPMGHWLAPVGPVSPERFAGALAWRLAAQWPGLNPTIAEVRRWVDEALPFEASTGGLEGFHLRFLAAARRAHPRVNPWYYDLGPERVQAAFPELSPPAGPPSESVLEEPPFITIQPWRLADAEALARSPLIIKTPSNAYRLPFWRALFPNARVRVLHLVRNAAAAVNGLIDGWRFRGFHAHDMRGRGGLSIRGYSDVVPGGERWWKYDLPPGWEAMTAAPLEQVCAFQWRSAHRSILSFLEETDTPVLRLRFEDLVGERREASLEALADWLSLGAVGRSELLRRRVPPVMATARPRARRWYERAELLGPVLEDRETQELMQALGYALDPETWT